MALATCCSGLRAISRAAARYAAARLRSVGAVAEHPHWARRATICETCPLRVVYRKVSYCGRPFMHKIQREPAIDGCGCPCRDKAADPSEHCPLDRTNRPAVNNAGRCTCKWCSL